MYIELVAPEILVPPFFHWYTGVEPPLVGMAVYVTFVPTQTGLDDALIELLTGRIGFTVMVMELEVAGLPLGQVALEVIKQFIASLLAGK